MTKVWVVSVETVVANRVCYEINGGPDVKTRTHLIGVCSDRDRARALASSVIEGEVEWCGVDEDAPDYDEANDDPLLKYNGDEVWTLSINGHLLQ